MTRIALSTLGLWLLASVAGQGAPGVTAEVACEADRAEFYQASVEQRETGPAARDELVAWVERLIRAHERGAPVCGGRLREHESYLLVLNGRHADAESRIVRYLSGEGARTTARSRLMLLMQLGHARTQQGRRVEGAQAQFDAAALAREVPARKGLRALHDAANSARVLGDLEVADRFFSAALALADDSLHVDPEVTGQKGLVLLGLAALTEDRLGTAPPEGRPALAHRLVALTDEAMRLVDTGTSSQRDGRMALALGLNAYGLALTGDTDGARAQVRRAHRYADAARVQFPSAPFDAMMRGGQVCEVAGDLACARASTDRARADARVRNARYNEADALNQLGRIAERASEWDRAGGAYRASVEIQEGFRDAIGVQDWSASAFAVMQTPYRGLVRVLLAQGLVEDAFVMLDGTRARYLRDLRQQLHVRGTLTDSTRQRADSLATALSDARLRALQLEEGEAAARSAISKLQSELESITGPPLPSPTLRVPALQARLRAEGQVLVSYMVGEPGSTAFVLTPDTLVAVPLGATTGVVQTWLRAVGTPWSDGTAASPVFELAPLHALYRALVEPLTPWLTAGRLVVVPDGPLATLPFGMLVSETAESYRRARYLVHDFAVTAELSAALVGQPHEAADAETDLLVFGRSTFEGSTWNGGALPPLPSVGAEVAEVRRYGARTRVQLGEDATEAEFRRRAPRSRVVHVATHAEADGAFPLRSRVALAASDGDDGTLYLHELMDVPLTAELVVLSGCSTGEGAVRGGEGAIGLHHGVRAAGAASTLATLWTVADASSSDLIADVYAGLARGETKDQALRHAQLRYLDAHDGLAASPFYWAAPVLSGDPSAIDLDGPGPPWWTVIGALSALAAGLAWRHTKRRSA